MTRNKWQDVVIVSLIVALLRIVTFYTPLMDVDESFFGVFASVMKHGGIPYIDASDNKPPLIFLLYYAMWLIFGEGNMLAMHILTAVCITLTSLVIRSIGTKIADEWTGTAAMFLYAVITTLGEPKLLAANINIFMMLPTSACFLYFISAVRDDKWWKWLCCGALGGMAAFMRYQGGMILFIIAVCTTIYDLSPKKLVWRMILGSCGVLIVVTLVFLYLARLGSVHAYILSFKEGLIYSEKLAAFAFWPRFLSKSSLFILATFPFTIMTVFYIYRTFKERPLKKESLYILSWFLLMWVPVCYGRRFYSHYFIMLMPPLALIGALGLSELKNRGYRTLWIASLAAWALFFFLIRFENLGLRQYTGVHPSDWVEISTLEYPVADYIKTHTNEKDRIFVWGTASPLYSRSERLPASRLMWLDVLINRISGGSKFKMQNNGNDVQNPLASELWETLFSDLDKNRPAYIIDTSHSNFGGYKDYPIEKFPLFGWMNEHGYRLETELNGARLYSSSVP